MLSTLERLYEQEQNWTSLRALWEATLERTRDPAQRASLTMRLGKLLTDHLDGHDQAIEQHRKVLELDPRNEASMRALQGLYRNVGRYDDLAQLLRRMMRLTAEPLMLKSLRLDLADALAVHMDRRPEGVEMGRRVLDIEPHSAEDLRRLVHLFTLSEAWEELAGVLERQAGLVEGAEKVMALERLADVFETQLKRPAAAAPAWERLLAEQPTHQRGYRRLEEVYSRDGKWQKLISLKDERYRRLTDVDERVTLLREIGRIREERLGQKEMAFL
ncbi:MAG: tetratricopeptide repeat protein, partial [Myxococcota bacterium]